MVEVNGKTVEHETLRLELSRRILLQNTLLLLSSVMFGLFFGFALIWPERAWMVSAAFSCLILAFSLQWCHHGIRTRQIKIFLIEFGYAGSSSWERWLPANRPKTLLGGRWMISTKGVFLGLDLAIKLLALDLAPAVDSHAILLGSALTAATAGFLLTNPKE